MTQTRMLQIWFGILGMVAGVAVLLSGVLTSEKVEAADNGIAITVVHAAPTK